MSLAAISMSNDAMNSETKDALRRVRLVVFDFDGVFTDNTVYVSQDGTESVRCNRSDGIGLSRLRAVGIETIIISTEVNAVVGVRAQKLKTPCRHGCENKREVLEEVLAELGLAFAQTAFVGNDVNDASCLEIVGMPIVVADAHPDVLSLARITTTRRGGHGAVREVCDMFAALAEHAGAADK